ARLDPEVHRHVVRLGLEPDVPHHAHRHTVQSNDRSLLETADPLEADRDLLLLAELEGARLEGRPEEEDDGDHDEDADPKLHEGDVPGSLHVVPPRRGGAEADRGAASVRRCAAAATAVRKGARNWWMKESLEWSRSVADPSKTTRPSFKTVIELPTLKASAMSCVTRMDVLPSESRSWTMRSVMSSALCGSSPVVGSS